MLDVCDSPFPRRVRRRRAHSWGDDAILHAHARTAIENMVTEVFGVAPGAMRRGTRGERRIANARQVAMYIAHVNCGLSLTDVGRQFGRDRTTVAHACFCAGHRVRTVNHFAGARVRPCAYHRRRAGNRCIGLGCLRQVLGSRVVANGLGCARYFWGSRHGGRGRAEEADRPDS